MGKLSIVTEKASTVTVLAFLLSIFSYTIPYKYLVSSETLSFFNSRHIDEEMVIPF
ncbi:protein of unknown function [Shewanella benthica]|uniref:Uncharacterized protein n=1 Tax=Shewanella benthica TaxID=43661 RepID=A0A330M805_9GAMM|nr:protein of unknown function [Shewanella benthica]